MKKYLENLCDELDIVFTNCECDNDWKEQVLKVLYDYISEFQNNTGGDIDLLLEDIKNSIKQ